MQYVHSLTTQLSWYRQAGPEVNSQDPGAATPASPGTRPLTCEAEAEVGRRPGLWASSPARAVPASERRGHVCPPLSSSLVSDLESCLIDGNKSHMRNPSYKDARLCGAKRHGESGRDR